jgi:NTP pyrophosphatase (non-canonical NTP hydrolase)
MDTPQTGQPAAPSQADVAAWLEHNVGPTRHVEHQALVLAEEVGEVCRAVAKRAQGIRGTRAEWTEQLQAELADVLITVLALAATEGFDLNTAAARKWAVVTGRDFTTDTVSESDTAGGEPDLLADVAAVMTAAGKKLMRTQEVIAGLAARNRALYTGYTFTQLKDGLPEAARPYKTKGLIQVNAHRVAEALTERDLYPDPHRHQKSRFVTDTPTTPAPEPTAGTAAHLAGMLQRYTRCYECGDHQFSPWPDDPDGGTLRIVLALSRVLPHLSSEALERVRTALRPDHCASGRGTR